MGLFLQARTLQAGSILLENRLKRKYYLEYGMHLSQRQEQKQDENNQLSTVSLTNTFTGEHMQDGTQPVEVKTREIFPRLK